MLPLHLVWKKFISKKYLVFNWLIYSLKIFNLQETIELLSSFLWNFEFYLVVNLLMLVILNPCCYKKGLVTLELSLFMHWFYPRQLWNISKYDFSLKYTSKSNTIIKELDTFHHYFLPKNSQNCFVLFEI